MLRFWLHFYTLFVSLSSIFPPPVFCVPIQDGDIPTHFIRQWKKSSGAWLSEECPTWLTDWLDWLFGREKGAFRARTELAFFAFCIREDDGNKKPAAAASFGSHSSLPHRISAYIAIFSLFRRIRDTRNEIFTWFPSTVSSQERDVGSIGRRRLSYYKWHNRTKPGDIYFAVVKQDSTVHQRWLLVKKQDLCGVLLPKIHNVARLTYKQDGIAIKELQWKLNGLIVTNCSPYFKMV